MSPPPIRRRQALLGLSSVGLGALGRGALGLGALGLGAREARAAAGAAAPSIAVVGATLWRPDAPPLEDAVILIADGVITYVGDDLSRADGVEPISAAGKVVTAGLVDALTSIGVVEVDLEDASRDDRLDGDDPVRAAFMTADGYNPASSLVPITRMGGLTSVAVVPHGGLVSGQSAWVDLRGDSPAAAIARRRLALHVHLDDPAHDGLQQSSGTALLRLRELFDDARSYQRNKGAFERRQLRQLGASRLDLEAVLRALSGELPLVAHVDRASDILAVLELARENGLRLVLASAAEAWKVGAAIAAAKVPVMVYGLDDGPRTFAALGAREDNAALLERAGVSVVLSTGESHNARKLRQVAGNAVRAGMSAQAALAAVTSAPAAALGMDDRYGRVEAGAVANLVVWSADPFELSTRVEAVLVRGESMPLRSRQTKLFERYR